MASRKRANLGVYELHVELEDIEPRVWQRLPVPASIQPPKLHDLLQLVMGWSNSHLHSFEFGERAFSAEPAELQELGMADEEEYTLEAALGESVRDFLYEYDFGDSWRHHIAVTAVARPSVDCRYPLCIAGARAASPEDVGGPSGYQDFLAAISDPEHEDHDRMLAWVGGVFDPEGFDLNAINRLLRARP